MKQRVKARLRPAVRQWGLFWGVLGWLEGCLTPHAWLAMGDAYKISQREVGRVVLIRAKTKVICKTCGAGKLIVLNVRRFPDGTQTWRVPDGSLIASE